MTIFSTPTFEPAHQGGALRQRHVFNLDKKWNSRCVVTTTEYAETRPMPRSPRGTGSDATNLPCHCIRSRGNRELLTEEGAWNAFSSPEAMDSLEATWRNESSIKAMPSPCSTTISIRIRAT